MPLKTLHLTNSWHETSGGIATFYRALIQQANERGHEIALVVPGHIDKVEPVGSFGKIYHVQAPPALFNSSYRMIYPTQFLAPGSKLQNIVASERPDVVEICDKYTLHYFGALLRRGLLRNLDVRPVVVGLSCERMDDNFRSYMGGIFLSRQFCSWYMRWIYFPFFDHHIANSRYTAAELEAAARGHLVPRGTWIRPMGVDFTHLSPERRSITARRRLLQDCGANPGTILLLYAGRLVPEKNLPLLFSLMDQLAKKKNSRRDFHLLVVGDGIERVRWERECAQRNPGGVTFLGYVRNREVLAGLYANSEVFVHPNPREPFGIAPLEAMASGLALVAPNAGGVTSYASPENAWPVEPNVESFAAAIEEAVGDEELRRKKVAKALSTAQQYRWEKVASSFLDLYVELHRQMRCGSAAQLPPDFHSTPPTALQRLVFHGISQAAQRTFVAASSLFGKSTFGANTSGSTRSEIAG